MSFSSVNGPIHFLQTNQGGFLPLLKLILLASRESGNDEGFPSAFKVCAPLPCQFHDEMGFLSVLCDMVLCMCIVTSQYWMFSHQNSIKIKLFWL